MYLHDVAGLSRAPTLFLCYLALFQKFNQTPDEMFRELKKPYKNAAPNIDMVQRVINDNKSFWEQQRARFLKEEERRKREEEEQRKRSDQKRLQDEAELRRLQ